MSILRFMNFTISVPVKGEDPIAEIVFPDGDVTENGTARIIIKPGNGKPDMGLYITRTDDGISLSPYSIEYEDGGEIDTFFVRYDEVDPDSE